MAAIYWLPFFDSFRYARPVEVYCIKHPPRRRVMHVSFSTFRAALSRVWTILHCELLDLLA